MIATAVAVRDLRPTDWSEVSRIYAEGIATGNATFETEVPSWEAWDARTRSMARRCAMVWIQVDAVPRSVSNRVAVRHTSTSTSWPGCGKTPARR